MSDWNIIVLSLFSATYLPLFWFVGMRIASEDILRKSKFYEVDPNVLVRMGEDMHDGILCFALLPVHHSADYD